MPRSKHGKNKVMKCKVEANQAVKLESTFAEFVPKVKAQTISDVCHIMHGSMRDAVELKAVWNVYYMSILLQVSNA